MYKRFVPSLFQSYLILYPQSLNIGHVPHFIIRKSKQQFECDLIKLFNMIDHDKQMWLNQFY